jgi:hypothetical protein
MYTFYVYSQGHYFRLFQAMGRFVQFAGEKSAAPLGMLRGAFGNMDI